MSDTPFRLFILRDIVSIVYLTDAVIGRLMLERIPVSFRKIHTKFNDFFRCVSDLNGICFYSHDLETTVFDLILKRSHKQGSAQGNDIISITLISKWIIKASSS